MIEDGNTKANERVFRMIMGFDYSRRVHIKGFVVTPTRYFTDGTTTRGENNSSTFA